MIDQELYVYNPGLQTSQLVASVPTSEIDLEAWGNSDAELIFSDIPYCIAERVPCRGDIVVYNPISATDTHRGNFPTGGGAFCEVKLSPNSAIISFWFSCVDPTFVYLSDLYLWDLSTNNTTRFTDFGQPFVNDLRDVDLSIATNTHLDTGWYDENQLVVGFSTASYLGGLQEGTIDSGLVVYDSSGNLLRKLHPSFLHDRLISPDGQWVVYKETIPQVRASTTHAPEGVRYDDITTHISQWSATSLTSLHTLPVGCNYAWSGDSRFFAQSDCSQDIETFTILDMNDGSTFTVAVPPSSFVDPIGWIPVDLSLQLESLPSEG